MLCLTTIRAAAFPEAGGSFIGLFADTDATICQADLNAPLQLDSIHLVASLNPAVLVSLEAVEFKITNLPPPSGAGQWTFISDSDITSGDLASDIYLAWSVALDGPLVHLGIIEIQSYAADYLGDDHLLQVAAGDIAQAVALRDGMGTTFAGVGGSFTFNCTGVCACSPSTPTKASSWSSLRALY